MIFICKHSSAHVSVYGGSKPPRTRVETLEKKVTENQFRIVGQDQWGDPQYMLAPVERTRSVKFTSFEGGGKLIATVPAKKILAALPVGLKTGAVVKVSGSLEEKIKALLPGLSGGPEPISIYR